MWGKGRRRARQVEGNDERALFKPMAAVGPRAKYRMASVYLANCLQLHEELLP